MICPVCRHIGSLTLIPLIGAVNINLQTANWCDYICDQCDYIITYNGQGEFVSKRINVIRVNSQISKKKISRRVKKSFLIRRQNING